MLEENENHENKLNFYQDIINRISKETQKKILSEIIKKLKEDIQESNNIFFYSEKIVKEIEDKFNLIQGPLNYIQDINNSSNGNPLSKGQFVSSGTNQISSDIYINENPYHGNNEETDYGIQCSYTEKKTNFELCELKEMKKMKLLMNDYILLKFVYIKKMTKKKKIMFDFIDFVFED